MDKEAIHNGHRERMRERIAVNGIQSLQEHEVLEFLLYAYIPRKDTNEIAHKLIDEFGSLHKVFNADIERLMKVKGITANIAVYLNSLSGVSRMYIKGNVDNEVVLNNVSDCIEFLEPIMSTLKREEVHILAKNARNKLLKHEVLSKGTVTETVLYIRHITDMALKNEASSIVIAHNHPSGEPYASEADKQVTSQVALALSLIDIRLDDHIIIAKNGNYSFRREGLLDKYANSVVNLSNGKIKDIVY